MVRASLQPLPKADADCFDGLLVDYAEKQGGQVIIRGLRAVSDFEFEFQLALMNRKLNEGVETIFMMPKDTYTFLSSRIVKEIARLGGDVSCFVPEPVRLALSAKFKQSGRRHALENQHPPSGGKGPPLPGQAAGPGIATGRRRRTGARAPALCSMT